MRKTRLTLLAILLTFSGLAFAQEKTDKTPKISGFVQGLYEADFNSDFDLQENTFRARRVRMSIDGKLTEKLSYKIQSDFINSPILIDAYAKYTFCETFALQAGQFKVPFTMETAINPVNLEIFDYGEVITKLVGYKDVCGVGKLGRDLGIMATGKLFGVDKNDKKFHLLEYAVGVFNGNGINVVDNNNRKDIAGRIEFHPWVKEVTLTGSIYNGKFLNTDKDTKGDRNRYSGGVQFKNDALVIRSEYVAGETGINDTIGNYDSNGLYVVAGYNFKIGKEKSQVLMPVLRYDRFDANTDIDKNGKDIFTVGINYWPLKCLNFKLDYSYINPESGKESHRFVALLSFKF